MKKILILIMTFALALTFTACGSSDEDEAEGSGEGTEIMTGAWTVNDKGYVTILPDDVALAFEKAAANMDGGELVPLNLMSEQVVAGKNYQILCAFTPATEDPITTLKVAVLYVDTEGNGEFTNIADFDLDDYVGDIAGDDNEPEEDVDQMVGGWHPPEYIEPAEMPDDVTKAFNSAFEGYTGSDVDPLAFVGSQVVSGSNYAILCKFTTVTEDPISSIGIVTIYVDTEGNASILHIEDIDPTDFTGQDDADD